MGHDRAAVIGPGPRPAFEGASGDPEFLLRRRLRRLEGRLLERDRLIRSLRERVVERGLYATWLQGEVDAREARIDELADALGRHSVEIGRLEAELRALRRSLLRKVASRARSLLAQARRHAARWSTAAGGPALERETPPEAIPETPTVPVGDAMPDEPAVSTVDRTSIVAMIPRRLAPYDAWLERNPWDAGAARASDRILRELPRRPTFSIVVERSDVDRASIDSIRGQRYPAFEVVPAGIDEPPSAIDVGPGGPTAALAEAARRAGGEYLLFLEAGSTLEPDALVHFAASATTEGHPPDLLYADEDAIDPEGNRTRPTLRPGPSPELLLARPYLGGSFAVRREAIEAIGGIRAESGHAWAFDLALRLFEHSERIARVPRLLIHSKGSPTAGRWATRFEDDAERVLDEALRRRGIDARVVRPSWARRERSSTFELAFPERGPKVAILIPTRDRAALLRRCLDSIIERTSYRDYEVVVLDNGSTDPETLDDLERLTGNCRVLRLPSTDGRFNYARLHNEAMASLDGSVEFAVLLNNDTEVIRADWLGQLVGYGRMPGVGVVGARLLYADGRLQHGGMLPALHEGLPGHAHKFAPWWSRGIEGRDPRHAANVGAVTAACLLVRLRTFLELGGFDAERFAVGYNDVDFCLRLREAGLRCVYAPGAELLHLEGASRGTSDDPVEAIGFKQRWGSRKDPYHHPSLARHDERLGIRIGRVSIDVGDRHRPPRLLMVAGDLGKGGHGHRIAELASRLRARGLAEPTIAASETGGMADRFRRDDLPFEGPIATLEHLERRMRALGIDLVHAFGLDAIGSLQAALRNGLPALWTIAEAVDFRDALDGTDEPTARASIRAFDQADRVLFPSWGVRKHFQAIESRGNFEVLRESPDEPSTFDDRRSIRLRYDLDDDDRVLLAVHHGDDREVDNLLRALEGLGGDRRNRLRVLIAGPDAAPSRSLRHRLEPFRVIDPAIDPSSLIAGADLVACLGLRDHTPRVLVRALRLGRPLLATGVDGIDELIRPGAEARIVRPGDPGAIRRGLRGLLSSRPDAPDPAFRDVTLTMLRSFDEEIERLRRLYAEALSAGTKRPSWVAQVNRSA